MSNQNYSISWTYEDIKETPISIKQKSQKALKGDDRFLVLDNLFSSVTYSDIYKNVDLKVEISPAYTKEFIVLKNKVTRNTFNVAYNIGTLNVRQRDKHNIELLDSYGNLIFLISAPLMFDSTEEGLSDALSLSIVKHEKEILQILISADSEWLQSEERVYPIYIDPTINTSTGNAVVQSKFSKSLSGNANDWGALYVGNHRPTSQAMGYTRTLVRMSSLPNIGKTSVVIDAKLYLYQYTHTVGTASKLINAYRATSDWNWSANSPDIINGMPSYDTTTILDYNISNTSSQQGYAIGWVGWDVTRATKVWYNDPSTNKGIYVLIMKKL